MISFKDLASIDGAEQVKLVNGRIGYKTERSSNLWAFNDEDVLVETDIACEPESNIEFLEEDTIYDGECFVTVQQYFDVRLQDKIMTITATEIKG